MAQPVGDVHPVGGESSHAVDANLVSGFEFEIAVVQDRRNDGLARGACLEVRRDLAESFTHTDKRSAGAEERTRTVVQLEGSDHIAIVGQGDRHHGSLDYQVAGINAEIEHPTAVHCIRGPPQSSRRIASLGYHPVLSTGKTLGRHPTYGADASAGGA